MKCRKITALLLCVSMLAGILQTTAFALSGEAEYTPAESNLSGKYWVSFSSEEGDAALAADGDLGTAWTWTSTPAVLLVDLGGTYTEIHKVETVFADGASVYQYKLEGSSDMNTWTVLADRTGNESAGANYADVFAFEGLRYVKLTVEAGDVPGVREFKILNYLRRDLNNGSDSSTVSYANAYYYQPDGSQEGVRGGQLTEESMETGENYFGLVKDLGWDITRLRVWNEPKREGSTDLNGAVDLENLPEASTSCSPEAQLEYAKYIIGAGQQLAIDFHYADSWADPQNQPKPYAWASLEFDELVDTVYDYTYDYIKKLIDQGTAPVIVAIGNEITNGMMWGSEYLEVNEYADYHDYYRRFIRDNGADNLNEDGTTIDGTRINPEATVGGGVKWVKYAEANGDTSSEAYQEFVDSVNNLARLVDAGNRAVAALNDEYGLDIQSEMHFAFNVVEQPRDSEKVSLDDAYVFGKVTTLISLLAEDLDGMGGMVDRIGVSYYPDWHGTYDQLQHNIVELSNMLPDVAFNVAECSPAHSGEVADALDNPNYPVGTEFTVQIAGDIAIDIMKTINNVPNNAGKGVWPWNGQSVYGVKTEEEGSTYTLYASFLAWNDAFAKNVVESSVSVATTAGTAPVLPATVKSLDIATGKITDVQVSWEPVGAGAYAAAGTFEVSGTAAVTVPEEGRGKAMDQVTATVTVTPAASGTQGVLPFADTAPENWFYSDVQWAFEQDLMVGESETRFVPGEPVSQATIVTVLARMLDADLTAYAGAASDTVASGMWYSEAAMWAQDAGLLSGSAPFTGTDAVSREEMAVMLVKCLAAMGIDTSIQADGVHFEDADLASDAGLSAFQILYHYDIFKGISGLRMDPAGTTTRAQFAALVHRLSALLQK